MMLDQLIVVQYQELGQQWVAHFDGELCRSFGGNMPLVAVRRLLEGTDNQPETLTVRCDRDRAATGILQFPIVWEPPEMLITCRACEGRGEYVGLLEREVCPSCGGRKVVRV